MTLILPNRAMRERHANRLERIAEALIVQAEELTAVVEAREKATAEGAGFAGSPDTAARWRTQTRALAEQARECVRNAKAARMGARSLRLIRMGADA